MPAAMQQLRWHAIEAPASGMLQLVNESALLQAAISRDVVLRMECQIGDFVVAGRPLVSTSGGDDEELVSNVTSAFTINRTPTIEQDAAFGLQARFHRITMGAKRFILFQVAHTLHHGSAKSGNASDILGA